MMANNNGTEEQQLNRIGKTLKEGERVLAPTRRPDGTLRKPIRIRAGYVPQDEVAIYQSKGALLKKGKPEVPPGYDPVLDAKPKTKAAKRNERKKEKKQQAAIEKGKDMGFEAVESKSKEVSSENGIHRSKVIESVACQMNTLSVSETSTLPDLTESSNPGIPGVDLDKRIRALKKKIRLTESQQQKTDREEMKPELLEKVEKLDDWREELKLLEDKKTGLSLS
ncbi:Partner of y14 and mago [Thalictrum thalictroides]|uniref:Partner of y14 and mago n=1 Tax=Thalictrum thalictroides TaxID=46969 RepID=A0A7J6W762_THATH|nr:Partner of y14 and mago [Thalictrum thalictroides]